MGKTVNKGMEFIAEEWWDVHRKKSWEYKREGEGNEEIKREREEEDGEEATHDKPVTVSHMLLHVFFLSMSLFLLSFFLQASIFFLLPLLETLGH